MSRNLCAAALALLVSAPAAHAGDTPTFLFNGFGTAGLVHSSEPRADFVANAFVPRGAGHTASWSAAVDSRLGLQLSAEFNARFNGVIQLLVEQQHDGDFSPMLEWAKFQYQPAANLEIHAGRMVLPNFMASEYRKVGYAIPWVRPPQEVYRLVPGTNVDGVGISHSSRFKGFSNQLHVVYGRRDEKLPSGVELQGRNGWLLADTLDWGPASLFASFTSVDLTLDDLHRLLDLPAQGGGPGSAAGRGFEFVDERFEIMAIGLRYAPGDWFVQAEWGQQKNHTIVADSDGWYVTGGYRFARFTPYATVAAVNSELDPRAAGRLATTAPGSRLAALGTIFDQQRLGLGVRWDFARNLALKAQYDYIDLGPGSAGVLANTQPGFEPGRHVSLFSLTLDLVF